MRRVSKREGGGCDGCPWNAESGNGSGAEDAEATGARADDGADAFGALEGVHAEAKPMNEPSSAATYFTASQ